MTYADQDFLPDNQEESPNYPTAFGITFTPQVAGIIFGVLGLLGSVYLFLNVVKPAWDNYQNLEAEVKKKQTQVEQQQAIQQKIDQTQAKLDLAKQKNKQVLNLFANEKTLDTILLDLNSFVKSRNGRLTNFQPQPGQDSEIINDSSLGTAVNGKLKRKIYNVEIEGSFDQVQSILRSFERLQTLLLVKDFKADLSEPQALLVDKGRVLPVTVDKNRKVVPGGKPTIKATFKLVALMPVSEDNAKAAATPAGKKAR